MTNSANLFKTAVAESINTRGMTDAVASIKQPSNHTIMEYRMLMACVLQHQILADFYAKEDKKSDSARHTKFAAQFRSEALRAKPE